MSKRSFFQIIILVNTILHTYVHTCVHVFPSICMYLCTCMYGYHTTHSLHFVDPADAQGIKTTWATTKESNEFNRYNSLFPT